MRLRIFLAFFGTVLTAIRYDYIQKGGLQLNLLINGVALLTVLLAMLFFLIFLGLFALYIVNKKAFPKRMLIMFASCVALFMAFYIYNQYFFTFDRIDRAQLQLGAGPVESPTGAFTAKAFYEFYGGVLGGVNLFVEVTDNKKEETKIIYYADVKAFVRLVWRDDETLAIYNEDYNNDSNGEVVLNIRNELYHDRGLACQSVLLRKSYKTCYEDEK